MGRNLASSQVEAQHVQAMGPELGPVFHALWCEVASIHLRWQEYVELFGTKPSRLETLNKTAPLFFHIVQNSLLESILIHLARLTDPPESRGKKNLTIKSLPLLITDPPAANKVEKLIAVASTKAVFCRDWRNRRIAHKDFFLALKQGAKPLQRATDQKMTEALDAIAQVMNEVESFYLNSRSIFERIPISDGAVALLCLMRDALLFDKERRERCRKGEWRPDDYPNEEL